MLAAFTCDMGPVRCLRHAHQLHLPLQAIRPRCSALERPVGGARLRPSRAEPSRADGAVAGLVPVPRPPRSVRVALIDPGSSSGPAGRPSPGMSIPRVGVGTGSSRTACRRDDDHQPGRHGQDDVDPAGESSRSAARARVAILADPIPTSDRPGRSSPVTWRSRAWAPSSRPTGRSASWTRSGRSRATHSSPARSQPTSVVGPSRGVTWPAFAERRRAGGAGVPVAPTSRGAVRGRLGRLSP